MLPPVLVVTGDPVGPAMAGPAIRAVELSRVLAGAGHPVVLAAPAAGAVPLPSSVRLVAASTELELRPLAGEAEVVVAFSAVVADHPWLGGVEAVLIVDAYDPGLLETLEGRRGEAFNAQRDWVADAHRHLVEPLRCADVVLVASDRQRHLVVGILAALGRIGPRTVAEDPALDGLVRVVPFGTPGGPPPGDGRRPITGPGGLVPAGSTVALWGGGLHDWLDPVTLVDAVARTRDETVTAVFLAGRHPTPAVGRAPLVDVARARARGLGLLGSRVVFHEQWVPYDERSEWLADADIGVSLHHRHVETEFAFRTRVLDYLWGRLPVVCSGGDSIAELVDRFDLGIVVPPDDVDAVAEALDALASAPASERSERAGRAATVASDMAWPVVTAPLLAAAAAPRRAADREVASDPPGRISGALGALRRVSRAAGDR
jgi:hypothetical protein